MKRFLFLTLSLISCYACTVQENADSVAVQQLPTPDANIEKIQSSEELPPIVFDTLFANLEKSNLTREDIDFKERIEREKIFDLKRLKSKNLLGEDLEIRVWREFGIALLQGFVLKRTAGEWSAIDLDWEVSENRKGKRDVKPLGKKLEIPKSGWDIAWQRLVDASILTLPDAEKINCNSVEVDGSSYIVEYKLNNTYRSYSYGNPNYEKCNEAKQMLEINRIIAEEFYERKVKLGDKK